MKTTIIPKKADIKRDWLLIDANNKVLGKLAAKVAHVLRGKNKVFFSPHLDCGDYVVITNAKNVVLTGNKEEDKPYYNHTGYRGNMKVDKAKELREKNPEKMIFKAVYRMLPDNRLRALALKRLRIYPDENHKHQAQQLKPTEI